MITLLALLRLMPYTGLFDLEENNFLQIVDNDTGAHYRVKSNMLLLGGDPCGFDKFDLYKLEVTCVEYEDDHCVISVKGR
jgi:hypothetical protein